MEQYTLKPEAFKEVKKKILFRSVPLMLIALAVGFSISHFNSPNAESSLKTLSFLIPAGIALIIISLRRGINRQMQLLESYTLTLAEDAIIREQKNTPTIRLKHGDIREIRKNRDGSYTIKGKSMYDTIGVPAQLQHTEALEESLKRIQPFAVEHNQNPLLQKLRPLLPLLVLGLMAVVYISSNKLFVGLSGIAVSCILIWSFLQIQRNKSIDHKTKRASYWTLLVLVSTIGITIAKLLAQ